ncbi:hypothetical protein M413DRAFT_74364 [Hebeloma cylindrosporum]|uniref:Uncharacterized protein n=1 Tax=Hebeloma cylindrosporum TaxID=76867 RepID=A0A0C3C6P5_HEBCY|nr:hypothetical protein M413DRAFT_74364 [Hebeloma cylindrosporum h7]
MGTLECSFDIDSETAIKWNFSRNGYITMISSDAVKSDITDHTLSLQICCFPTNLVEETFRSLQHNATPEDIASAIFSLKTEWPLQGHLIIVVNPQNEENHTKKVFLPEKLGPGNSPISIKDFVQQGKNIVQFIQLSNMAGKVFALCAKKKDTKPDDVTYASKEDNIIRTPSGVVKVLPL